MKKFTVLVGVMIVLMSAATARADFTLNFTGSQVLSANTVVTNQYSSYGINFYKGTISTLKGTYPWFPNYTFQDAVGNTVTTLLGPTFDTPTNWINQQNGTQTEYPSAADTPTSDFLGFDKNDTTTPAVDAGTVMKFTSPINSLSLTLSRPGRNAGNIALLYIYLFNSNAAGGTKLVASKEQFTVYTGGDGTPEWVAYDSPPVGAFDVVVIYSNDRFMLDNLNTNPPKLATPVLASPANGVTSENTPNETTLVWDPVLHAGTYYVTWAYRAVTKDKWSVTTTSSAISGNENTSYKFDAPNGDGEYEWSVTAHDSTGVHSDSANSFTRTIFFNSTLTLQTPKQVSPQQNAAFYNVPRTATLAWQQVAGATGYMVDVWYEVFDSTQRKNVWVEDTVDGFPVTLTDGQEASYYTFALTLPSGVTAGPVQCRWRVAATGTTNANSGYSGWQTFEFEK